MKEPKLRFKQADGASYPAWEEKKLGDITEKVDRRAPEDSEAPVMMISQGNGFIYQADKYSRENAGQSLKKYYLLKKGEMAYNHGASKAKPYGVAYVLKEEDEARIPFVYHAFKIKDGVTEYWHSALNTSQMDRQLKRMVSSGVRMDGLLNINYDTYMDTTIFCPSVEEQHKIAEFLSTVDARIVEQDAYVADLQKQKKGFMQQIFSQELRFAADDGSEFPDWEVKTIGEISDVGSASRVHREEWREEGIPFFRSSDVMAAFNHTTNNNGKAYIDEELYERLTKKSGKLHEGDILITGGGSIGTPYLVPDNAPLYTKDADLLWVRQSDEFESGFLYQFFLSPDFRAYLMSISHIGTIAHYTISQVKATPINLPSLPEQKRIAEFFSVLDEQIANEQAILDDWKLLKKGLLQQMFV